MAPHDDLLQHSEFMRRLAHALALDGESAEDLCQDIWVAALGSEAKPRRPRPWIRRVMRNLAAGGLRRESRRRRRERRAARDEAVPATAELVELERLRRRVLDSVLALETRYRDVVLLRFYENLPPRRIAERLAIPVETVKTRLKRGLARLRSTLEGDAEDGATPGRAHWALLPASLALPATADGAVASIGAGAVVMSTKAKLAATAVLVLLCVTGGLWWTRSPDATPGTATPGQSAATGGVAESGELGAVVAIDPGDLARNAGAGDAAPGFDPARLDGRVVDADGFSIGGAWIRIEAGETGQVIAEGKSGADGTFDVACSGVPENQRPAVGTTIRWGADGYVSGRFVLDDDWSVGALTLKRRPVLRGRLLDEDGEPVPSPARVRVTTRDPKTEEETEHEGVVDENGEYVVEGLPVSELVRVWGRARGFGAGEERISFHLEPESVTEVDLRLPRGAVITGRVIDATTSRPIPYAEVWAEKFQYDADAVAPVAVADRDGRYVLEGVAVESRELSNAGVIAIARLYAQAPGYAPPRLKLYSAGWEEDEPSYEFDIPLESVRGTVAATILEPGGERPAVRVVIHAIDALRNIHFGATDGEGRVTFEGIPDGEFAFHGWRGDRDRPDQVAWVGDHFVLKPGTDYDATLELRTAKASVRGTVLSEEGEPVPNLEIRAGYQLRLDGMTVGLRHWTVRTDADGSYEFPAIPGGDYSFAPVFEEHSELCAMPGLIELSLAAEEVIEDVDFAVGKAVVFAGVLDLDGERAPWRYVIELRDPRSGATIVSGRAGGGADLTFELPPVFGGEYEIVLFDPDGKIIDRMIVDGTEEILLRERK